MNDLFGNVPFENSVVGRARIYTVGELTREIKDLLQTAYPLIWVDGEVSNLICSSLGHIYFTLKDENAQVKVVIFKTEKNNLKFEIENGLRVIVCGRISVYEKSGQYQIYAQHLEPKGIGALQIAFEKLKEKLRKEGLFEQSRKRQIPFFPRRVGVVTSKDGAAFHDIINIMKRRWTGVEIILRSVKVQGEGAAQEVVSGIEDFNSFKCVDCIIVGRGGGSLEDLWAFNEECVARAVYHSKIPVISAVGHEVDWTISDFVADLRAPTPSAAAELVMPNKDDLENNIFHLRKRLQLTVLGFISSLKEKLKNLSQKRCIREPKFIFDEQKQRIDEFLNRLNLSFKHILQIYNSELAKFAGRLNALSPLSVLERGYSITFDEKSDNIIRDTKDVKKGQVIKTKILKGEFLSRVC
ncbi:exodeoxyribonuclease VII large subunit [bacterium Unc6]|nr:exodeoxyribonuclease VII large subunit [bacterium Unc6]